MLKFLVGAFDNADEISIGKPEEKAPRQLIVRGMPLKLMHLSPTSRMSSAAYIFWACELEDVATRCSSSRESGEFIVIVAAVETVSHAGRPTCLDEASLDIRPYSEDICRGAAVVPGRAWAALMSALRDSESFDMSTVASLNLVQGKRPRVLFSSHRRFLAIDIISETVCIPKSFRQIVFELFNVHQLRNAAQDPRLSMNADQVHPVIQK